MVKLAVEYTTFHQMLDCNIGYVGFLLITAPL